LLFVNNSPAPLVSSAPELPSLLLRLRTETRPYHDALEQNAFNQALTAGNLTAEATAHFLAKLYGFLVPYEAVLRQHASEFGPAWELDQRFRAHLILQDLQRPTADPGLPICPAMPPLDTHARLLGAMYVMEGSTLGGQVITRQLAKAEIPLRRYFAGYGERTGPMWKAFCQLLTEAAPTTDSDEIVASASRTFQHLEAWINQP
jgi:heme oxygenase